MRLGLGLIHEWTEVNPRPTQVKVVSSPVISRRSSKCFFLIGSFWKNRARKKGWYLTMEKHFYILVWGDPLVQACPISWRIFVFSVFWPDFSLSLHRICYMHHEHTTAAPVFWPEVFQEFARCVASTQCLFLLSKFFWKTVDGFQRVHDASPTHPRNSVMHHGQLIFFYFFVCVTFAPVC